MAGKEIDLLKQFKVEKLAELSLGGVHLDFTNVALYAFVVVGLIWVFLTLATRKLTMVPGRMQSMGEIVYELIARMITDVIGPDGMKFLPLVFSIFSFVLVANLVGLIPGAFTVTSHLSVTLMLGLTSILTVIGYGILKKGFGFLKLFAPAGLPFPVYFIVVPIEMISFLARPFTLGVRLFGNMLAGHMVLKLFGYFVVGLAALGGAWGILAAMAPLVGIFAVTALELLVALVQAYVFAMLTVIYLNDVVNDHH